MNRATRLLLTIVILGMLAAGVVGVFTVEDEGDNVATQPEETTTSAFVPSTEATTTVPAGTTATTTPTTAATSAATSAATTAVTTAATTAVTTATTAGGSGLGTGGAGGVGGQPLSNSGGEYMLIPAILLGGAGWGLRRVVRRAD